jgi:hypothetical protein
MRMEGEEQIPEIPLILTNPLKRNAELGLLEGVRCKSPQAANKRITRVEETIAQF